MDPLFVRENLRLTKVIIKVCLLEIFHQPLCFFIDIFYVFQAYKKCKDHNTYLILF